MKDFIDKYAFIKRFLNKKITTIQTAPFWNGNQPNISDEAIIGFSDGKQIVIESSFEDVDLFFDIDEDVQLSMYPEEDVEAKSNIGELQMLSVLVDEVPSSIELIFDEVCYIDSGESNKILRYPVGLLIKTETRTIGIWRDAFEATWLNANYHNANIKQFFSVEEKWGRFEDVPPFKVSRYSYDFFSEDLKRIQEETFCK